MNLDIEYKTEAKSFNIQRTFIRSKDQNYNVKSFLRKICCTLYEGEYESKKSNDSG